MVTVTIILFVIHWFRSRKFNMQEEKNYSVLKQVDGFEYRAYQPTIKASVILKKELKKRINVGFKILFPYIDGKNNKKEKIDLVSPMIVELLKGTAKMSFILPKKYNMEDLPLPQHHRIILENCKAKIFVCLKFGGFASNEVLLQKKEELKSYIRQKKLTIIGPYEYHNYNNPYTLFNRYNEIAVPILSSTKVE